MNGVPTKEQRGGWVEGSNSNKSEKSVKAIQRKPEGKPLWKLDKCICPR